MSLRNKHSAHAQAKSIADLLDEHARIAEALLRIEKANTAAEYERVRRKLVWLHSLGSVIAAAIGLPIVTYVVRLFLPGGR